ncbi:MAG TPA: choice-of-anchor D domain-containing protein, partial [Archangium sp.]
MNRLSWLVLLGALIAVGCRDNKVQKVTPTLGLESLNVDFGPVRVDTVSDKPFVLSAMNGAAVQLTSVTVEGDAAFSLDAPPELVPGSSSETLTLKFAPKSAGDVTATLVVTSDDELAPERRVELTGRGAYPKLTVEVACDAGARCEAVVASSPPSIDFAPEPFVRLRPIEPSTLPQLRLRSTGEVPVVLS